MPPKKLDTTISTDDDEKTAATYDRQAVRSQAIAHRHTQLAVESAGRGDDERSRFEAQQGRLAWEAAHLDRQRARALRSRAA